MDSDDPAGGAEPRSFERRGSGSVRAVTRRLPVGAGTVTIARQLVTGLLSEAPRSPFLTAAKLAVSEIVTNAVVHGRGPIDVTVVRTDGGCRVEVYDQDPHLPRMRWYANTAATGRGLHLVASVAERWGADSHGTGKVVWFELGEPTGLQAEPRRSEDVLADDQAVVTLSNCPLLLHLAWQERSQAILREYLSAMLTSQPTILPRHAEASAALNVLDEQIPGLGHADASALLIDAVEPQVTAAPLELRLTREAAGQLKTLRALLAEAAGRALPGMADSPANPELDRFQDWLFAEVARQTDSQADSETDSGTDSMNDSMNDSMTAEPWRRPVASAVPTAPQASSPEIVAAARRRWPEGDSLVVMDQAGVLVRVARPVRKALGYRTEADLVGRPLLMLVPERFRQAHLAGIALHTTNGRDALFRHPVTVPILAADGTEVLTRLQVRQDRLPQGADVFVGDLEFVAG